MPSSRKAKSSASRSSIRDKSWARDCCFSHCSRASRFFLPFPVAAPADSSPLSVTGLSSIARETILSWSFSMTDSALWSADWMMVLMYSPLASNRMLIWILPWFTRDLATRTAPSSTGSSTSSFNSGSPPAAPMAAAISNPQRPPVPGIDTAIPFL